MSIAKNLIVSSTEKYLKSVIDKLDFEDKFNKQKYAIKVSGDSELNIIYDNEASIKSIIDKEALEKAVSTIKKAKKDTVSGDSKLLLTKLNRLLLYQHQKG